MIWIAHLEWEVVMDLRDLWKKIAFWFDPDRDWRSVDKLQHAVLGFVVALLLLVPIYLRWVLFAHAALGVLIATLVIGLIWELAQAEIAHSQHLLGKPGYGIGLVDLAYDGIGALILLWFRFLLRLL